MRDGKRWTRFVVRSSPTFIEQVHVALTLQTWIWMELGPNFGFSAILDGYFFVCPRRSKRVPGECLNIDLVFSQILVYASWFSSSLIWRIAVYALKLCPWITREIILDICQAGLINDMKVSSVHAMKTCRGVEVWIRSFLNSAFDRDEWSAVCPCG
jgi:hypothetical protein